MRTGRFRTSTDDRPRVTLAALLAVVLGASAARAADPAPQPAATPRLGQPASAELVARWNLSVYPDGRGLPVGRGTAAQGRLIYQTRCAKCHGADGEGGSGGTLVGRGPLTDPEPDQTVGNYWPYATTLFDYIRRAMPMDAPATLSDDEVYSVSAYLLYLNKIIGVDDRLDADSLPRIRMPNRDGFIGIDAELPASAASQHER
jgi:S-disulfanyl-L-cysteine oxidoreductase SoxD